MGGLRASSSDSGSLLLDESPDAEGIESFEASDADIIFIFP